VIGRYVLVSTFQGKCWGTFGSEAEAWAFLIGAKPSKDPEAVRQWKLNGWDVVKIQLWDTPR
jgi:hypothetical protein